MIQRIALIAILLACGCASRQAAAPATQPSIASGRVDYWNARPAESAIQSRDFDKLWSAAEETAREFGFRVERQDFRSGVITTQPLVSKQWFELWRKDVTTAGDLAESSIATHRRTLRFDIDKTSGGGFVASPRVVVERYSQTERSIRASIELRNAFRTDRRHRPTGTRETDRGIYLPRQYWYAIGRDAALEQDVAKSVEKRLRKS